MSLGITISRLEERMVDSKFAIYCSLEVNLSLKADRLEMRGGQQCVGILSSMSAAEYIWQLTQAFAVTLTKYLTS
jgi:hypothetical protein